MKNVDSLTYKLAWVWVGYSVPISLFLITTLGLPHKKADTSPLYHQNNSFSLALCKMTYVYFAESDERAITGINRKKFSSIDNVSDPLNNLQKTSTIIEAFDIVKQKKLIVLHCYGIPGSGKSQLARSLAKKFPYSDSTAATNQSLSTSLYAIKWHVQCKDNTEDLKEEFKYLAEVLEENGFIEKAPLRRLDKDFKKNEAKVFVDLLLNCNVPVLLLIEDPSDAEKQLLLSLFNCLNEKFDDQSHHHKFHIYVTLRSLLPETKEEFSAMEWLKTLNVNGFSKEEAIIFLKVNNIKPDVEEDLLKVYQRFSGMPLGLLAAKRFCQRSEINYETYLLLAENSDDIFLEEKEAIGQKYGQAVEHVFQAIVMLFFPGKDTVSIDTRETLHWKMLCCISYFHYDRIPRFLLERCCHCIREKKFEKYSEVKNEVEVGKLINNLLDHGMCTKKEDDSITFHEVVLNAFRLKQHFAPNFNPLKKAMEVVCGLLSLDLRRKENYLRMPNLQNHLQALLEHVENNQNILEKEDDFESLNAVISRLYQDLAVLLCKQSNYKKSNEMYQKSFNQIWSEKKDVISHDQNKTLEEIAKEIIKDSKDKIRRIPSFLSKYLSWIQISHFKKDEIEFLKSESKGDFAEIEKDLNILDSKIRVAEKLKACKLFLPDDAYLPIFFAERFASIMHGWSRNYLYSDGDQDLEKGLWMSSLSKAVSLGVKASSKIPLLTEWLSQISGQVPFLLKQKDNPNSLQEALRLCHEMIKGENLKMFENGLIQKAFNPPALTKISLFRYIVRINTRLVNSSSDPSFLQADKQCEELIELIEEHIDRSSYCIAYMIYCGKYYAARKNFDSALQCFRKFYQLSTEPEFDIECWAAYNYARAVRCASSSQDKDDAIQKIKIVLESNKVIKDDLKNRLEAEREILTNLV